MRKARVLALHGLGLIGLLAAAAALATWRGALWPFDIRATVLMTASGLAGVLGGWGPVWILPLAASAALPRGWQRLALWPLAVLGMAALHAGFGPARGFAPAALLQAGGLAALYAVPAALALVLGSALRHLVRRGT